jgi:hypothetical protein
MADLEFDRHDLTALDLLIRACTAVAGGEGAAARALRAFRRELNYASLLQAGRSFDALGGGLRVSIAERAYGLARDWRARPTRHAALAFAEGAAAKVVPWVEVVRDAAARVPPKKAGRIAALIGAALLLFALGGDDKAERTAMAAPALVLPAAADNPPAAPSREFEQVGVASWYGKWHHGRPTATGESFDMNGLTAAHRSLPLDSRIRVTNLDNGKLIEVKVNDRGPYIDGRVLDLSMKAAERLEMKQQGLARVKIERVE